MKAGQCPDYFYVCRIVVSPQGFEKLEIKKQWETVEKTSNIKEGLQIRL